MESTRYKTRYTIGGWLLSSFIASLFANFLAFYFIRLSSDWVIGNPIMIITTCGATIFVFILIYSTQRNIIYVELGPAAIILTYARNKKPVVLKLAGIERVEIHAEENGQPTFYNLFSDNRKYQVDTSTVPQENMLSYLEQNNIPFTYQKALNA